MNNAAISVKESTTISFWPARHVSTESIPWIPLGPGKSFKPLRFFSDNRGFTELLKVEPGTTIPTHRHTGEVHAYNIEGWRELSTGELIGPGDFVFEPSGNVDSWSVVGDAPCIVFVTVGGAVETLNEDGEVTKSVSGADLRAIYLEYCKSNNLAVIDLAD